MSDKRKKSEILSPAIYSKEEIKAYAKQHWNFTFARQKKYLFMLNVLWQMYSL
ncbi:MAG: hypothetical protein OHK0045_14060 [Raineya sp.]